MTLKVVHINQNFISQWWPNVEEYIQAANEFGGDDYTLDQIKVYLTNGSWILLVALDAEEKVHGSATVSFMNYPNDRVAFITFMGGKLITNQDTYKQMANIFKSYGATKIQGASRPAAVRLWKRYGLQERYTIVEVKI